MSDTNTEPEGGVKGKVRSHKAEKVLERLSKKLNRQIVGSLVACVHCGNCTESCHYVLANPGDPTYAPAYKADRLRKIFKKHHDLFDGWTPTAPAGSAP